MKHRFAISDDAQGGLLTALGAMGVRLVLSRQFLRFVRPGMKLPLLAASILLIVLGLATLLRAWRTPASDDHAPSDNALAASAHGHDHATETHAALATEEPVDYALHDAPVAGEHTGHSHAPGKGPGVGWLLALPLAVLLLIEPTSLGAYAASRQAVKTTRLSQAEGVVFDPLPAKQDGHLELSLTDFSERGLYDSKESLKGQPVRLVGFVNNDKTAPGGFFLTRFKIACCAADAYPIQVVLLGDAGQWPDDTWLTIDGVWKPTEVQPDAKDLLRAQITVQKVTKMTTTPDPYE
jgi:uncharacterized repeat protein (TIGR03943 family)